MRHHTIHHHGSRASRAGRGAVALTAAVALCALAVQSLPGMAGVAGAAAARRGTVATMAPHVSTAAPATLRTGHAATVRAASARRASTKAPADPLAGEGGMVECAAGTTITLDQSMPAGTTGYVGVDPGDDPGLGADSVCTLTGVIPAGWSVYAAPYSLTAAPNADGTSGVEGTLTLGSWYDGFTNGCYGANLSGAAGVSFVNEGTITQENYLPSPGCGYPSPDVSLDHFTEGPAASLVIPTGASYDFDYATSGIEGTFTDYGSLSIPSTSKLIIGNSNCPSGIDYTLEEGATVSLGSTATFDLQCGGIDVEGGTITGGAISSGNEPVALSFGSSVPVDSTGTVDFTEGGQSLSGTVAKGWTVKEDDGGSLVGAPGSGNAGTLQFSGSQISDTGTFTNTGVLDATGGGTINSPDVVNSGTIEVTGPLTQRDGLTFSYDNATAPGVVDNAGTISVGANQYLNMGPQSCKTGERLLTESGSSIDATGDLYMICGELDLNGGSITSSGPVQISPIGAVLVDYDTGLSAGTGGAADTIQSSGSGLTVEGAVPSGWSLIDDGHVVTATPGFSNAGTIELNAFGSGIADTGPMSNSGTLEAPAGQGGTINVPSLSNSGTIEELGTSVGNSSLGFTYDNATTAGTITNSGTISVLGGTLTSGTQSCKTGEDLIEEAGSSINVASATGTFDVQCGELDLNGGSITSSGPVQISPIGAVLVDYDTGLSAGTGGAADTIQSSGSGLTVEGAVPSGWSLIDDGHVVTATPGFSNAGTIELNAFGSGIADTGPMSNSGTLEAPAGQGGTINVPSLSNSGTIEELGTSVGNSSLGFTYDNATTAGTITNSGTISVLGGTLTSGTQSCKTGEDLIEEAGSSINVASATGTFDVQCGELDLNGGSITSSGPVQISPIGAVLVDYDTGLSAGTGGAADTVRVTGSNATIAGSIPTGWTLADASSVVTAAPGTSNAGLVQLSAFASGLAGNVGTFDNAGTITVTNGASLFNATPTTIVNTGTVSVAGGNTLSMNDVDFVNRGTVNVGANANFEPEQGFSQSSSGTLGITVNAGQYGEVYAASAPVSIDGTVAITTTATPTLGASLPIVVSSTALTGTFATTTGAAAGSGLGYLAAYTSTKALLDVLHAQAISYASTPPSGADVDGPTYSVAATGGGSSNPVTFTVDASSSGVCSISGSTVSFVGAGTCTVDANQAGTSSYLAAPLAQQSFTVAPGSQVVAFTSTNPATAVVGGSTYSPTATSSAALTVTVGLDSSSSGCALSAGVVRFTSVGTCLIDANQAGSANFLAAPQAQQAVAVGKGSDAITITSKKPASPVVGGTYKPKASATSGTTVTISLDASSKGCTMLLGTVAFVSTGTCVIDFTNAASTNYLAAPQVQQTVIVGKGTLILVATASPATARSSHGVKLSGRLSSAAASGTVTFRVGAKLLCTATVTRGAGTCTVQKSVAKGAHTVTATYSGSASYDAATATTKLTVK